MAEATTYVCDRCGERAVVGLTIDTARTWAEPAGRTAQGLQWFVMGGQTAPPAIPAHDLCGKCVNGLRRWLSQV